MRIYIIKKYVVAENAADAIKKEKNVPVHDVWLEENSAKDVIADTIADIKKKTRLGF